MLSRLNFLAALGLAAFIGTAGLANATSFASPPEQGRQAEQAYVTTNVNLRAGPGTNHRVIGKLTRGDFVNVLSCQGSWCQVQAGGQPDGWVSGRFIGRGENPYHSRGPAGPGIPPQEPGTRTSAPRPVPYDNDALPSAEVSAFQAVDARLGYRNARIEYDDRNCAVYQATGRDGRTYRELLRNPDNTTICRP